MKDIDNDHVYFFPVGGGIDSDGCTYDHWEEMNGLQYIEYELQNTFHEGWKAMPEDMKQWLIGAIRALEEGKRIQTPD